MNEPHLSDMDQGTGSMASKLNWLRAGVLGANDGIVSIASIVVGVSGAAVSHGTLVTTGVAALVAGALSMGTGEYVSVSTQRDSEKAALARESQELKDYPEKELAELTRFIEAEGIPGDIAGIVSERLTAEGALAAHARYELGIRPDELTNPWEAALSSTISFAVGAIIPLVAIIFTPQSKAVIVTMIAVMAALAITGGLSARMGKAPILPATMRNVIGGFLAMAITYFVGRWLGTSVA